MLGKMRIVETNPLNFSIQNLSKYGGHLLPVNDHLKCLLLKLVKHKLTTKNEYTVNTGFNWFKSMDLDDLLLFFPKFPTDLESTHTNRLKPFYNALLIAIVPCALGL